ncbi:Scr1 family TA system antitoxin-like transcriptional regulator [Plantactinospora sp. KBS50]|uniref:Scr1 family TA system antitoxin-like transcriptional regulator n=1 Tax=Plantactinospora sp. KBS50 TaxID=2024580 RepID=UPI000BAB1FB6|nr:hypothetical protein CIK06_17055 [Plantactinospora sp. KBS50]
MEQARTPWAAREHAEAADATKPGVESDAMARSVAVRLERQQLLTRAAPKASTFDAILDVAALRRRVPRIPGQFPVCGAAVIRRPCCQAVSAA